jgi:hypothetical protein
MYMHGKTKLSRVWLLQPHNNGANTFWFTTFSENFVESEFGISSRGGDTALVLIAFAHQPALIRSEFSLFTSAPISPERTVYIHKHATKNFTLISLKKRLNL